MDRECGFAMGVAWYSVSFNLGSGAILDYLTGADLGMDRLLVRDLTGAPDAADPSRTVPCAAAPLLLAAIALLAINPGWIRSRGDGRCMA
jgi:hypothetical protein